MSIADIILYAMLMRSEIDKKQITRHFEKNAVRRIYTGEKEKRGVDKNGYVILSGISANFL